jgi:hypothetical protein
MALFLNRKLNYLFAARTSRGQKDYYSRGVAEYAEMFFIINFFTPRLCVSACKKYSAG